MLRFQRKINQLTSLKANVPQIASDFVYKHENWIKSRIKNRWQHGKKPDGTNIGRYRSPDYQYAKINLNPQAGGNVDLILTGSLVNKILVQKVSKSVFRILSDDYKFTEIALKYGIENFNISNEDFEDLENKIKLYITKLWVARFVND
jgi:hypothetical protein